MYIGKVGCMLEGYENHVNGRRHPPGSLEYIPRHKINTGDTFDGERGEARSTKKDASSGVRVRLCVRATA